MSKKKKDHKDAPIFYSQGLFSYKWGNPDDKFARLWAGTSAFTTADPATARHYFDKGWEEASKMTWEPTDQTLKGNWNV